MTEELSKYKYIFDFMCENVVIEEKGYLDKNVNQRTLSEMSFEMDRVFRSNNFRYSERGFMAFNGKIYIPIKNELIPSLVKEVLMAKDVAKLYIMEAPKKIASGIILNKMNKTFIPSNEIISFNNGVLLFTPTGCEFHSHDEKWQTNKHFPIDYDDRATCPMWLDTLENILPEVSLRMVLQEYIGLALINRKELKVESALYLLGGGSNGKSVIYETVAGVMGLENICNYDFASLCDTGNAGNYNRATADGKIINWCSDMSSDALKGTGLYKSIVSNEGVPARAIGCDSYTSHDMPLLIANVNKFPSTIDHSDGFWRRALIIPFQKHFAVNDKNTDVELPFKLRAEYSGVFNWIIKGRERLIAQKGKFTKSESIEITSIDVKNRSNTGYTFFSDLEYFPQAKSDGVYTDFLISLDDFYQKYVDYCKQSSIYCKSRTLFKEDIAGYKFEKVRTNKGMRYKIFKLDYHYENIGLFSDEKSNDSDDDAQYRIEAELPF